MAETTYRSGITGKALALAPLPFFIAGYLLWIGFSDLPRFSENDPMRWPLAYAPIFFGVLILLVVAHTVLTSLNRVVTVTPSGVHYAEGGLERFHAGWSDFHHISRGRGLLRILVLSDGRSFGRVPDVFFPRYDELVKDLERHEKAVAARTRHKLD